MPTRANRFGKAGIVFAMPFLSVCCVLFSDWHVCCNESKTLYNTATMNHHSNVKASCGDLITTTATTSTLDKFTTEQNHDHAFNSTDRMMIFQTFHTTVCTILVGDENIINDRNLPWTDCAG